jgi:hypothetical protein
VSEYSISDGVLVCDHVVSGQRKVLLVVHHSDGMWSFMCGQSDHDGETGDGVGVAHVEHIFADQPELEALVNCLSRGFLAEFENGDWRKAAHDD